MNDKANQTLKSNGDLFLDTISLINHFKDFSFPNQKDKIQYLKQAKTMESTFNQLKEEFDRLTYKITRQNKSIIDSNRVSRLSTIKNDNLLSLQQLQTEDLMYESKLKEKEDQIKTIQK